MSIKIAINGFGRIGRATLRALFESKYKDKMEIVAINDMGTDLSVHAYLLQYDSVHGKFNENVSFKENTLFVANKEIKFFSIKDPKNLPWKDLEVDVVLECTGVFTNKVKSNAHIEAGAKKVIISAPSEDVDATIVYGVNHQILTKNMTIISNASCTTNCLAPVVQVLHQEFGIVSGLMTTIHSYTNDQVLTDSYHNDKHRARAGALSMIPTKTGAAKAVGIVLPELNGKLDGIAIRVPTPNVSLIDFSFISSKNVTSQEVNKVLINASQSHLKDILAVNYEPLVSIDFNHNSHSSIVDLSQTKVIGNLVKVYSWYDNEWGFSNRMLDNVYYWFQI